VWIVTKDARKELLELTRLVIVESPTKARTIGKYLGSPYVVLSSQGHVRDLPKKELGVDVENEFTPKFETKRTKQVTKLRQAAKKARQIYLATDNDREGEAIAYDLYTILKRVVKDDDAFLRPVFNEITKPVILEALSKPARINVNKVEAQRTRRILDRLVGYQVSPLLSRAIAGSQFGGLSAGRVQSVALRFLCDREAEIALFVREEYWEIYVCLRGEEAFTASLTKKNGKKFVASSETEANKTLKELQGEEAVVKSIVQDTRLRQPPPPFITSSLQRAASSSLGFAPKRTMSIAQQLYEGVRLPQGDVGLITYMRTDSVRMSGSAVKEARQLIAERYGKDYLSAKTRHYRNKKRSQDAHEAIRPTTVSLGPEKIASWLSPEQRKLYALIYKRFLSTQMSEALYKQGKVTITAGRYTLEATGSTLVFDGFLTLYPREKNSDGKIPNWLREGQILAIERVDLQQKFTEPPRRYSEAGLISILEKKGIGRPSTYATIVSVIQTRDYVRKKNGSLYPTLLGEEVTEFLKQYFPETVEAHFTAQMEKDLDRIEEGQFSRADALQEFYDPFSKRLTRLESRIKEGKPFRVMTDVVCDKCKSPMELRYWKGSHFVGCSNYPECRNTRSLPAELPYRHKDGVLIIAESLEKVEKEMETKATCPVCGEPMTTKSGRYGRYLRCTNPECNKTTSIPTGVSCPSCEKGMLVERYSQKRRQTFYGCDNYPSCRYAMSERPVKACPTCGHGVLVEKKGKLVCNNKNCSYSKEIK